MGRVDRQAVLSVLCGKGAVVTDPTHIKDLIPDAKNARKHNTRNIGLIEKSLNEVGAARSIVIDEDGVILAGNGTVDAASAAGITRVRVVEADGHEIIAVRRRGLTDEQKTRLALFDNQAGALAEWDPMAIATIRQDDASLLDGLFTSAELDDILEDAADAVLGQETKVKKPIECPACGHCW